MYVDNATIVNAVFVGERSSHFDGIARVFRRSSWMLRNLPGISDLLRVAKDHEISVVFCDAQSKHGTWRDVLKELTRIHPVPRLFVLQPQDSPDLWGEVVHAGGWDVLRLPIREAVVDWLVREAAFSWPSSYHAGRAAVARSSTNKTSNWQFA